MAYRRRKSMRKPGYKYTTQGVYFVTINAWQGMSLFGSIRDGVMYPSDIGQMIITHWYAIPTYYTFVELDAFQLMPTHLHGIIVLRQHDESNTELNDDAQDTALTRYERSGRQLLAGSLSVIVGAFKAGVTRSVNRQLFLPIKHRLWHRNYYDVIIGNDDHLNRVRWYIRLNVRNYGRRKNKYRRRAWRRQG